MTATRVLRCAAPGCLVGIRVDLRHADNLAGRWTCPDHRTPDVSGRPSKNSERSRT